MKQLLQNLRNGTTEIAEVPAPQLLRGHILIRTSRSLVSAGTERMLVDFGKANIIDKARQQPDKVRMVLEKVKTDGLAPTLHAVRNKLDQPLALGYCNVGRILEVGPGVSGFEVGDRVASNGKHAEVVAVPASLCAKVPDAVKDDAAAFTVLSSIALQGIRLAKPTLGETFAVTGLGLIGLVTVQLLRAHGCRVIGLDFSEDRLKLAQAFGAEVINLSSGSDPVRAAETFTRGNGADGVIITAIDQEQRARSTGSEHVPQTRPDHPCRCDRTAVIARRLLRERANVPGLLFLWTGALRSELRTQRNGLPYRVRALDRAAQFSRPSSTCWRTAA